MQIIKWTEKEDVYLKENYGTMTAKEIGEYLGRTTSAVRARVIKLNLKSSKHWTKEQEEYLTNNLYTLGIHEVAKNIGKSVNAIRDKATNMGLREPVEIKSWTDDEDVFLRENYIALGVQECADRLKRSYHTVQNRANKVLDIRNYANRKWTEEEMDFLREHYPKKLGHWCAEKLGRGFHAVHKMVEKLGVKPEWKYKYLRGDGYYMLCHDRDNHIMEHRYIMEQFLGRKLTEDEVVHHINEIKTDNRIENLIILSREEHVIVHTELERWKKRNNI